MFEMIQPGRVMLPWRQVSDSMAVFEYSPSLFSSALNSHCSLYLIIYSLSLFALYVVPVSTVTMNVQTTLTGVL